MKKVKRELEALRHEVKMPPEFVKDADGCDIPVKEYYKLRKAAYNADHTDNWIWERKARAMIRHFKKVEWCEAILVVNLPKNGVDGYVGANTLMEMGLAFYLGKRIFMLYPAPDYPYCKEEITAMKPVVINGDLALIR